MSGYRSLKRVLGETNLERKCRWLFGICVGGLIFLAFTWVGWIAEDLIDRTARYKGHDLARIALYNLHWIKFEPSQQSKQFQRHLTNSLTQETIEARFIKTDGGQEPEGADTPLYGPENEFEVELLRRLDAAYQEQLQAGRRPMCLPRAMQRRSKERHSVKYGGRPRRRQSPRLFPLQRPTNITTTKPCIGPTRAPSATSTCTVRMPKRPHSTATARSTPAQCRFGWSA
jgi:hypothetical protein